MLSSPLSSLGLYSALLVSKVLADSGTGELAQPQEACKYSKDRRKKKIFFPGINAQLESYDIPVREWKNKYLNFWGSD